MNEIKGIDKIVKRTAKMSQEGKKGYIENMLAQKERKLIKLEEELEETRGAIEELQDMLEDDKDEWE
jgi:hypothetical protein